MYARSTSLTGDPQRMDDGIRVVRDEIMPAVQGMPGCIGLSMLIDRNSGRCIITTSWDSAESMVATAERVQDMRQRALDTMGGRDMSVDEWEVAAMHRSHTPGNDACARVTWARVDPAQMESMIDGFRMTQLSLMDGMDGFCSVSMMVDRNTGRCSITSVWKDEAAMEATRDQIAGMRTEFSGRSGMEVSDVHEFALAIHHLRVPEMA
jgi:heme-degrading monooxygenase HmoA